MELPAYWLARPALQIDRATAASFDALLHEALQHGPGQVVDYRLSAPKWQFLCHAADRANLVLHGSGDPGIELFEPRQPDDTLDFSNRRAVFAATDGIWPMFYAVLDRDRHPVMMVNACVRLCAGSGEVSDPYYFFSISDLTLTRRPWRTGMVYLLPGDSFETQPTIAAGDIRVQVAQAASAVPVRPVAKICVQPADFPFLGEIRGHDDGLLRRRMAADPAGFPWL
jgi:hypothetical protein